VAVALVLVLCHSPELVKLDLSAAISIYFCHQVQCCCLGQMDAHHGVSRDHFINAHIACMSGQPGVGGQLPFHSILAADAMHMAGRSNCMQGIHELQKF
jgi:hypothetical protein